MSDGVNGSSTAANAAKAEFVRESMRRQWAGRTQEYTAVGAQHTVRHSEVLLAKLDLRPGQRVLDVASGPGTTALPAAALVGPTGAVVATDLTPEWGEVIAARCSEAGLANVTFHAMNAEALDFADESFDVAVCTFGLMFVPDPVQALREMRRVLRPGGRLGIVVWSAADKMPYFAIRNRVLAPITPQPPPERRLPGPLELGTPGLIERHVAAAGFHEAHVDRHTLDVVIDDPEYVWRTQVEAGLPAVRAAAQALAPEQLARIHDELIQEYERYRRGDKVYVPCEATHVTAVR